VQVVLKVYVEDASEFEDLRGWMTGQHPGVAVTAVPKPPEPYTQGSALWDFLSLACGPDGAGAVAVGALAIWIRSRVQTVRIEIGEKKFLVKGHDVERILPKVVEAVNALEEAPADERS
jgi:Effector Associated Constant Component 1